MSPAKAIAECFSALSTNPNIWVATKYLSAKQTVRITRRRFQGKITHEDSAFVLSVGQPNYAERVFIKDCKNASEPFPVGKVQLKLLPKRRACHV